MRPVPVGPMDSQGHRLLTLTAFSDSRLNIGAPHADVRRSIERSIFGWGLQTFWLNLVEDCRRYATEIKYLTALDPIISFVSLAGPAIAPHKLR